MPLVRRDLLARTGAALAAGLALYWRAQQIWDPLASFLTDEQVSGSDKTPAFDRLAEPESTPSTKQAPERGLVVPGPVLATRSSTGSSP